VRRTACACALWRATATRCPYTSENRPERELANSSRPVKDTAADVAQVETRWRKSSPTTPKVSTARGISCTRPRASTQGLYRKTFLRSAAAALAPAAVTTARAGEQTTTSQTRKSSAAPRTAKLMSARGRGLWSDVIPASTSAGTLVSAKQLLSSVTTEVAWSESRIIDATVRTMVS
jgi:hypothetical protein